MGTNPHNIFTKKLLSRTIYILIPIVFLVHIYLFPLQINLNQLPQQPPQQKILTNPSISPPIQQTTKNNIGTLSNCNYTDGKWIQTNQPPLYNGTTCQTIKDGQNCMTHGRPDTGYLYYAWQPNHCDLQHFSALAFLNFIRDKHVAFIGDSMARNQLESLICLLSTASSPELAYRNGEDNKFRRWVFKSHNASVSVFWSPFLVKGIEKSVESGLNHNKLHLESADDRWAAELDNFDVTVFSIGHWFLHPAIYHENGQVLGCHHCPEFNNTEEIGFFDVFRKAVRTTLRVVRERHSSSELSGHKFVVVTTFSPAHFEGEWDKAGACPKKEPYKEGEKDLEYMDAEMRKIEVEEVASAKEEIKQKNAKLKIEALDVTRLAMLRPDGHPGPYMYPNPFADGPKDRVQNDCVHWCLPGPIDAWNEILFDMVKRWYDQTSSRDGF